MNVTKRHPQASWPGRFIDEWHCGGMSMVLLQLKDPLELFVGTFNLKSIERHPQASWPGRYIDVQRFGGLSMVLLQLKGPLVLFVGILSI